MFPCCLDPAVKIKQTYLCVVLSSFLQQMELKSHAIPAKYFGIANEIVLKQFINAFYNLFSKRH